jgi:hypothetical protein
LRLSELYSIWSSAPFGLKKGVMPVLALAFFLANKSDIAIYFNELFTPSINEVIIDELLHDPRSIKFKYVSAGQDRNSLANSIAQKILLFEKLHDETEKMSPLDAASGLVSIALGLPNWTKRTNSVSRPAQEVRSMLLKASDPNKVLFADLPTILESDSEAALVDKLTLVMDELRAAYPKKLAEIRQIILEALQHPANDISDLKSRAQSVKGITGNFQLESFATRIEEFDGSDGSVESLISNAINKPAHQWVDRDLDAAILQLGSLAMEFRRAEALAGIRGRDSDRKVFNVVLSAGQGIDLSRTVEISKTDQAEIDAKVTEIFPILQKMNRRLIYAALADLGIRFSTNEDEIKQ